MLRVTREQATDGLVIRLEGDLIREVVDVARRECTAQSPPQRLFVDLQALGRADDVGLGLLRELRARADVKLLNCSSLLHTMMNGYRRP
jgi:ABC-type transporter Mla MlaB component